MLAKKLGNDFKDISKRDYCNEKITIFNEVDKVTNGGGQLELDHIKMAVSQDGDLKVNLGK